MKTREVMENLDQKEDLAAVQPPILLKVRTAKDELVSPMPLLAFPVGGQGEEESGGSLGVHPPILLEVRTAQDDLASPMLPPAFPVGGQGEVMLLPAFPVGRQGEVELGSLGNQRDNHLNVKKRFVPKP